MVLTQPDPPPDGGGGVVSPDGSTVTNLRNSIARFWNNQVRAVTPPGQRPTFIAPSAHDNNSNNNNNNNNNDNVEERLNILRTGSVPHSTPSTDVSDVTHSSKLAFLHGASIEELQQALSLKTGNPKAHPPTTGIHPRAIFPTTVGPDSSPDTSGQVMLPVGQAVFCRVNGTIVAGEVASVPVPPRNFYLIHSAKTDNYFEVPNCGNDIWEDETDISKRHLSLSTASAPTPAPAYNEISQLRKELWTQRQKTDFKKLPTSGKECMIYHDDMYILLGCKAWRTKEGLHILDSFATTEPTKDLSSELYHLLTRGTTTKGTSATEAFPIMKDPAMVDKGLECYWAIFQQFCPLHQADVPRMLKDFHCTLQLTGQAPLLVRSKLTIQRSWLLKAGYEMPETAVIMQLAIALEFGAYAFAYDDLWMSYRRGERNLFDESLESLVEVANTYLTANKKACPNPGVYAKVANPPLLAAPDHNVGGGVPARARPATINDEEAGASEDPEIIQKMLAAGPVNDDVAKQIRDTFKCVFHLQPWPRNRRRRTGHFLTKCNVCLEKYKCEYIGGRQQDRDTDSSSDQQQPRGRRAGSDNPPPSEDASADASGTPDNSQPSADDTTSGQPRSYADAANGGSRNGG